MALIAIINWIVWFFIAKKVSKNHGCIVFAAVWFGGVIITSFIIGVIFATIGFFTAPIRIL